MNARSALFDVFGDYIRLRGGAAPVAALVRVLAPLDIAPPAVRTAVSRMVKQGWLRPLKVGGDPGYALTPTAEHRLGEAARRIYRTRDIAWDGRWRVVVVSHVSERPRRDRVANALAYLGFGRLAVSTWVSPNDSDEVVAMLDSEGVPAHYFIADQLGDAITVVAQAWDLPALAEAYERWTSDIRATIGAQLPASDEEAFVARSVLVHEWRKFLFRDPALPPALLPVDWPGTKAAAYFDAESSQLMPAAARFVETCLSPRPDLEGIDG